MAITVHLHLDRTEEDATYWWAEAPRVPGFSAAADSMSELCTRVQLAIDDLAAHGELDTSEVAFVLGETVAMSGNPTKVDRSDQGRDEASMQPHARVLVG